MRRNDREIKNKKRIEDIIRAVRVCRVGFVDGKKPYVLPFNFGYNNGIFYIHSAAEGRKLKILGKNSNVCVEIDAGHGLKTADNACGHGFSYKSVIAEGKADIIKAGPGKKQALRAIMRQQTGKDFSEFRQDSVDSVVVLRIKVSRMTGKQSGYN
jgi:nitroimidazol reductase NimA-like FMN-containing flavoprotein (pyridoxamine 5'-phosphate oxidase superfamily)